MTAKIKLNAASGGGSFSLQAPSPSSNNRVISLPDIADGTLLTSQSSLDSTKLSPAITAGITYANIYRLHTNFTHSGTHTILTNWEEADDGSSGKLGSGWSLPSSGVFSFPATGIYLVRVRYNIRCTGENGWPGLDIKVTQNNGGAYDIVAESFQSISDLSTSQGYSSGTTEAIVDCTDTGQVKFTTLAQADGNGTADVVFEGSSSTNKTTVSIIRLGDT